MHEKIKSRMTGHVLIRDKNTGEVILDTMNAVHVENMSEAQALSLANRPTGHIHAMVFGNGASTISGTGAVSYFPPNVTGQLAQLYNQTASKVIDDMSPLNTDPTNNNLRVQHVQNNSYSDIIITCTLAQNEPQDQEASDQTTNNNGAYVFNELGLKAYDPSGEGKLLTHAIFHPVQKALNRTFEVIYTIRNYMS